MALYQEALSACGAARRRKDDGCVPLARGADPLESRAAPCSSGELEEVQGQRSGLWHYTMSTLSSKLWHCLADTFSMRRPRASPSKHHVDSALQPKPCCRLGGVIVRIAACCPRTMYTHRIIILFGGKEATLTLCQGGEASKQHTKHETTAHPGAHQRNPTRAHQPHMHEPTGA